MATATDTKTTMENFQALVNEIHDFGATQALLGWDLETHMPEKGAPYRAKQMATLAKFSQKLLVSEEMDRYLTELRDPAAFDKLKPNEQALVREVGRSYDKRRQIPMDLLEAMVETTAEAHQTWVTARAQKDFSKFAPLLERIVDLNRQMAEALGYEESPYDALLDEYEPDLTVSQLNPLFEDLKGQIVPLLKAITESGFVPETKFLETGKYPIDQQMAFSRKVLDEMGFDFAAGRLDLSAHPFSSGASIGDVRLTTRVNENEVFSALSSSMHEGGHGMYEQGIDPALSRTPLSEGTSLGIHESQSRMWENQVGRSKGFWQHYFPQLQKTFAPSGLDAVTTEQFYAGINIVKPSFIRVESDEVTYNLHILVRFEIEKAVIEGRLPVAEIPAAWNAKMQEYLGITPPDDSQGCLQDIHWSHGSFGYFPTYTLGNLYAAQFFNQAKKEIPGLEAKIAQGDMAVLREWLRNKIHKVGKSDTAATIVQRVTGPNQDVSAIATTSTTCGRNTAASSPSSVRGKSPPVFLGGFERLIPVPLIRVGKQRVIPLGEVFHRQLQGNSCIGGVPQLDGLCLEVHGFDRVGMPSAHETARIPEDVAVGLRGFLEACQYHSTLGVPGLFGQQGRLALRLVRYLRLPAGKVAKNLGNTVVIYIPFGIEHLQDVLVRQTLEILAALALHQAGIGNFKQLDSGLPGIVMRRAIAAGNSLFAPLLHTPLDHPAQRVRFGEDLEFMAQLLPAHHDGLFFTRKIDVEIAIRPESDQVGQLLRAAGVAGQRVQDRQHLAIVYPALGGLQVFNAFREQLSQSRQLARLVGQGESIARLNGGSPLPETNRRQTPRTGNGTGKEELNR